MTKDQCISVTDLRLRTKKCLEGLDKKSKYIFINNKPVAVLMDIDKYESALIELSKDEVTEDIAIAAKRARKSKKKDLINI